MFNYKLAKILRIAFFALGCILLCVAVFFLCKGFFGDTHRGEGAFCFYVAVGSFITGLWLFLGALATQHFSHQLGIDVEPEEDSYEY